MYSELAISTLAERIKWNTSLDSAFAIELSDNNKIGSSGKHFQSFHNLVSIDNIYAAVPEIDMEEDDFNALLTDIRLQATLQALNDVLETNEIYDPLTDYSELLISNAALFDNLVGFKVAINVLEMFLSTIRINLPERNVKLSASNLKLELKGFRNDNGHVVANGIEAFYQLAINKASKKIFPINATVQNGKPW
jgi:hypothetical protein